MTAGALLAIIIICAIIFIKSEVNNTTQLSGSKQTIRCPYCGSPAEIKGDWWECGYCGDSGKLRR